MFDDGEPSLDAVAEEAHALAERLRDAAMRDGVNLVIDTTFTDADQAVAVGRQLADAGYVIDVVDIQAVETTAALAYARDAAQRLAADVDAVTGYRRYVVNPEGNSALKSDLARATVGGPLVDAGAARALATARTNSSGLAARHGNRGLGD
ncbi:zeta toxin family protein [Xylanimonas ulmi]|uniref:UDP-N-acetylglucosamine kinase n=1 Tax=Xylanimonas ulmi TaxID=228973 RepID=A0A4Q7M7V1_9MICO|nr:zeta toxin family protein [Xylanibacterium ulmi]RZS62209.1 zeta toxin [Xylanibacterium ulmi]